jgi:hypothetical protein
MQLPALDCSIRRHSVESGSGRRKCPVVRTVWDGLERCLLPRGVCDVHVEESLVPLECDIHGPSSYATTLHPAFDHRNGAGEISLVYLRVHGVRIRIPLFDNDNVKLGGDIGTVLRGISTVLPLTLGDGLHVSEKVEVEDQYATPGFRCLSLFISPRTHGHLRFDDPVVVRFNNTIILLSNCARRIGI